MSKLSDGAITWRMRKIGQEEPRLLDVLDIPLETHGPDFGHQPENRLLAPGEWIRIGAVKATSLVEFCEKKKVLLHTDSDRVPETLIAETPPAKRYSLQLISVDDATFHTTTSVRRNRQIRATFSYAAHKYSIVVTDPIAEDRVGEGEKLSKKCILTVSMGGPYDGNYFKFVAAVIEL